MPSDRMFPQTATLRRMRGSTGQVEPILGEPQEVACLLAEGLQRIELVGGREEVSTTSAYCQPEVGEVPTGSTLQWGDDYWTVVKAEQWRFPGRVGLESVVLRLR